LLGWAMKLTITSPRRFSGMMWQIIERTVTDALTASGIKDVEIKLDASEVIPPRRSPRKPPDGMLNVQDFHVAISGLLKKRTAAVTVCINGWPVSDVTFAARKRSAT